MVNNKKKSNKGSKIDETNTLYWEPWEGNEKGWKGCSVSVPDIKDFKEKWQRVELK